MLNKSRMTHFLSLSLAVAGFILIGGNLTEINAQCKSGDPFCQPSWKAKPAPPKTNNPTSSVKKQTDGKKIPPAITPVAAPAVEMRINYYKKIREEMAANNQPIPKVTSVLTLDELAISGIFKTSRGFAAMVEAVPIKLSFTIYPGEKFFDGQLVAIEENRLVFRKVVKMSNNKFVTSVENKALRQYTIQQEVQGTAPVEANTAKTEQPQQQPATNNAAQTPPTEATTSVTGKTDDKSKTSAPTQIISPVDEMNKQPASEPENSVKDKNKKNKKPTKVAKKS